MLPSRPTKRQLPYQGRRAPISLTKVFLTFLIPYLVSTYTSVSKELQASR